MAKSDKNLPPFEEAVEKLEQIIEQIESGETGLQDCLEHYEQGMKLVTHCRTILSSVEKRIAQLSVDGEGKLHIDDDATEDSDDSIEPSA